MEELYKKIRSAFEFGTPVPEIPKFITENIKHDLFEWQKEALEYFLVNQRRENEKGYSHLMFNMATGSGKTLIMASLILYYYQKGYRHFLFFVNQNNIIDKTENNFVNDVHNKYLFSDKIEIEGKIVNLKKVDNFSDDTSDIEIKFTTIQKLYNDIHLEKENNITLEEIYKKDIVMLADEAHHLNTKTINGHGKLDLDLELKEGASKEEIERKGWEHTVIDLILEKNRNESRNVLLEFTATIPTESSIVEKYKDKTIYKFSLKDFLKKGYTKEINLIGSTFDKKERILHALLFNWYRHKIALKNDIANFKPVILFRSKTIEDSKKDYQFFMDLVKDIEMKDFNFLKKIENKISENDNPYEQGRSRTEDVLKFILDKKTRYLELVNFVKDNFQERNIIITNSKDKKAKGERGGEKTTEDQDKLLNSLEDKNNNIRAIFTVKRLTEGWDVLNLFDIVRLYEGQNVGGTHKGKTPETTIQEKQLIGRGVRYSPFSFEDKERNKRKFDNELKNELRVLEELYYYTYDDPNNKADHNYIIELKAELRKDGYIDDGKVVKKFDLKEEFKNNNFYKKIKVWKNEQIDNPDKKKGDLENLAKDFFSAYKIKGISLSEEWMKNLNKEQDFQRLNLAEKNLKLIKIYFKDFDYNIFRKAININSQKENSFYRFSALKDKLKIESVDDLLLNKFFGRFEINIIVEENKNFEDIDNKEKLKIAMQFLNDIENKLKSYIKPKIGTREFKAYKFSDIFGEAKTKSIDKKAVEESEDLANVLKNENWYILNDFVGTDEEVNLIKFIQERIGNLDEKYKEYYLLRNEEIYKIYNFDDGLGFQPDFLLFLKSKKEEVYYQLFIEPKGKQYLGEKKNNQGEIEKAFEYGKEGWKANLLEEITKRLGNANILKAENDKYKLFGLLFFNNEDKYRNEFEEVFNKFL
ncbi:MAG: DEAD/DEAH box helicase family protein [Candidatus Moraniibacteriota bacterium]